MKDELIKTLKVLKTFRVFDLCTKKFLGAYQSCATLMVGQIVNSPYYKASTPMTEQKNKQALFESLVFNENQDPAEVAYIGSEAHYVILDDGFKRHVEAEIIDRQIVGWLQEQIFANQDMVTQGMMQMMGKDDLFTKAMIDSSIKDVDKLMQAGIPPDARMMLGMMGFRIIVNVHGEVVDIAMPEQSDSGE